MKSFAVLLFEAVPKSDILEQPHFTLTALFQFLIGANRPLSTS
jgi:hypothetical protein